VADDTGQLHHQHADNLGAVRGWLVTWAERQEALHCQSVAQVVGHTGDVVQAVGERHVLEEGVALPDLLVVAVEVAHDRLQAFHRLAVERDDHAEHAVCAGMVRAEVDDQAVGLEAGGNHLLDVNAQADAVVIRLFIDGGEIVRAEALRIAHVLAEGIALFSAMHPALGPAAVEGLLILLVVDFFPVLTQRVAVEAFPEQDALEVGMALEGDAHQVVGFALLEVGARPDADHRGQGSPVPWGAGLDDQRRATGRDAIGVVNQLEVVALAQVVHGGGAGEVVVPQRVAGGCGDFDEVLRADDDPGAALTVIVGDGIRELRFQRRDCLSDGVGGHCFSSRFFSHCLLPEPQKRPQRPAQPLARPDGGRVRPGVGR